MTREEWEATVARVPLQSQPRWPLAATSESGDWRRRGRGPAWLLGASVSYLSSREVLIEDWIWNALGPGTLIRHGRLHAKGYTLAHHLQSGSPGCSAHGGGTPGPWQPAVTRLSA